MIISKALEKDQNTIHQLWREHFAFDDGGYTDFYFSNGYQANTTYLLKNDDEIISTLQVKRHTIQLGEHLLAYSFIIGIITKKEYQKLGYMRQLLNEVLKQLSYQDVITMIQGYKPEIYFPFDFKPFYYHKKITIDMKQQTFNIIGNVKLDFPEIAMFELYQSFTKYYQGYRVRPLSYYRRLNMRVLVMKEQCVCRYDAFGKLTGYAIYCIRDMLIINELIYDDEVSVKDMLGFLQGLVDSCILYSSSSECHEKLVNNPLVEKEIDTLLRVNDQELWNKLYGGISISTFSDIFLNEYE